MSPNAKGLQAIVGFSIRNWRMTLGLMLFMVLGGIFAMFQLSLDAEPDIPVPFVNVQVVLPGVSPEDSERLLVRPLETEIKSVEGLKQIDGIGATNVGYVILEFDFPFDKDAVIADVQEKVNRARAEFPQDAREPIVQEVSTSALPIVTINLWGDVPERELQRRAKDMKKRIEAMPEVLSADISGERTDVLEAVLDPAKVESLGITYGEIAAAVSQNNSLIPAGALESESGKFNVKLPGLIKEPADMSNVVVRRTEDGAIVRLGDIADVRRGYRDVTTFARFNGRPSVSIEVSKRQGQNIIVTEDNVMALVRKMQEAADWPSTMNVSYSLSRTTRIKDMVSELFASLVNAIVLVFLVCVAALGWRSAIFVGWAVPGSFLIALFLFLVQGQTINMMILFGLILSVGVLVDSAIVIIEYADRKMDEGVQRVEAFKLAGERMFWPIISSTATTLAAFIPLLFWQDITGKFMSYFPITMIYVLSASTLMALIFLPVMGAKIGFKKKTKENNNAALLSGAEGDPSKLTGFTGGYVRVVSTLIKFPLIAMAAMVALAIAIVFFFQASVAGPPPKPVSFFTQTPSDQVYILARARGNTTPEQSLAIGKEIERRIDGIAGIESVYTVAGAAAAGSGQGGEGLSGPSNVPADTAVRVYTELLPFKQRRNVLLIMDDLREATIDIPGVFIEVIAVDQGPPIGKDIGIQLSGENRTELIAATKAVRRKLLNFEGLEDIEDSLPLPGVEWELEIDRAEAGRLGLDVSRIGAAVQFITEGALVGKYRPLDAEEEVDIRIRYPEGQRDLAGLDSLRIQTPQGALPLSSVVKTIPRPRLDKIERRDLEPYFVVQANTVKDYATNVQTEEINTWLSEDGVLPSSVSFKFLGQAEENAAAAAFFQAAGVAIILMMSIILLLQFNSFYHVFLTLMAVILSIFGVLLGLAFYPYISMILALTGVIALAGIVVNNNIVLIDTYQRLRENGFNAVDAAIRTSAQRLRPVILTTLTTVVGLMPLILGWQANIFTGELSFAGSNTSEIWAPISYVIACGLGFATILTLVITPVLLAAPWVLRDRLRKYGLWFQAKAADDFDAADSLRV